MHSVLISLEDVVVNVLKIFFDHQLEDKFVESNKINLFEMLNQVHQDLLDHIEMLFIQFYFIIHKYLLSNTC